MNWSDLVKTRPRRMTLMVAVFLLLLVVASFWLPARWHVQREVVITAKPAVIYPYLNNLKQWRDWTVWYEQHPNLPTDFSGPESGVGATSRWKDGENRGALKIMGGRTNASVEYTLIMDGGDSVMHGLFLLVPAPGDRTRVIWRAGGDTGLNPLERYKVVLMKYFVGRDFSRSLEKLRVVAEAGNPAVTPVR